MACTMDHEEWTVHMVNDRTGTDDILIFCFKFVNGVLTGTVTDANQQPLSTDTSVKGVIVGIGDLGTTIPTEVMLTDVVSFNFRWDQETRPIRVSIAGFIYRDDQNQVKFAGRFRAIADPMGLADHSRTLLLGPGDGDTGTGSGTQT